VADCAKRGNGRFRKRKQNKRSWQSLRRKLQSPTSLTAGIPGKVVWLTLNGNGVTGPDAVECAVEAVPSVLLFTFAIAPCTHACTGFVPLLLLVVV
jgi:hypothetical protein